MCWACNVIGIWGCGEDMSDRHFPQGAHIYVDHSIPRRFSVADSGWRFPQKQETLPPSIRSGHSPTKLITQARRKEHRVQTRLGVVSLFKIQRRADTGSQKDHNILPPGVGVPRAAVRPWGSPGLHFITANTRLWPELPPLSVTVNTHPMSSAWMLFKSLFLYTFINVEHPHCRQCRPEFSDLRQPLTRQLKTWVPSLTRTISPCPHHRKVAQMNHDCHCILNPSTTISVTYSYLSNLLSRQKMLSCRKRKKSKDICNTSLQNITIVGSTTLLLLLFGLFLYCFYFVYTTGFLPNKAFFKFDKTPVQTMTKSLQLEKSILGRFFLTKYLCHLCVQLVHGSFL